MGNAIRVKASSLSRHLILVCSVLAISSFHQHAFAQATELLRQRAEAKKSEDIATQANRTKKKSPRQSKGKTTRGKASGGVSASEASSGEKTSGGKSTRAGTTAIVKTEGALVYAQPDFDSEVLGSLSQDQKIRSSRGTTGAGAKFYRVRVGGVTGYVADIDLQVEGAASSPDKEPRTSKKQTAEKSEDKRDEKQESKKKERLPIFFSKFVGVSVGQTFFKEGITGVDAKEALLTYGLKVTGPDVVFTGPVIDFDLVLHYGAPTYYEKLSATKPTGFVMFANTIFLFPILNRNNQMVFAGAGPLGVLSSFKVTNSDRVMDLTALNLGLAFSLGGAVRFENVAIRLDGRYYYEKQSYPGLQLSVQSGF